MCVCVCVCVCICTYLHIFLSLLYSLWMPPPIFLLVDLLILFPIPMDTYTHMWSYKHTTKLKMTKQPQQTKETTFAHIISHFHTALFPNLFLISWIEIDHASGRSLPFNYMRSQYIIYLLQSHLSRGLYECVDYVLHSFNTCGTFIIIARVNFKHGLCSNHL